MSATHVARSLPHPTYPNDKHPCWRCGIIRYSKAPLCVDCKPYANDFEREK